jgi:hypothetical protein
MVAIINSLARLLGEISRVNQSSQLVPFVNTDVANMAAGMVVVADPATDGGALLPSAAGDNGHMFVVRELRQGGVDGSAPILPAQFGTGMKIGFVMAKCVNGSPAPQAPVYYRYALGDTGSATRAVGTLEAAPIANEVIEFPGATWNGLADANGLVEIRINA